MKIHVLTTSIIFVIASIIGVQSATHALTKSNVLTKQIGLQTTQPQFIQSQATQLEPQTTNGLVDQAGQTFFNHPPLLVRVAASQIGAEIPSTYEFTLTVPKDAGQPLRAVASCA